MERNKFHKREDLVPWQRNCSQYYMSSMSHHLLLLYERPGLDAVVDIYIYMFLGEVRDQWMYLEWVVITNGRKWNDEHVATTFISCPSKDPVVFHIMVHVKYLPLTDVAKMPLLCYSPVGSREGLLLLYLHFPFVDFVLI